MEVVWTTVEEDLARAREIALKLADRLVLACEVLGQVALRPDCREDLGGKCEKLLGAVEELRGEVRAWAGDQSHQRTM